jgi:hypothetical protein
MNNFPSYEFSMFQSWSILSNPNDDDDQHQMTTQWLERLITKFTISENNSTLYRVKLNFQKLWNMNMKTKAWWIMVLFVSIMIANIPIGQFWLTYAKRYLLFRWACPYVNEDFQAKCYKKSALIMFDIGHIVCSYACIIVWDWSWQYGLEDNLSYLT